MDEKSRKLRSGQVTLLALLLGVLGLTIGLSVASRSLSDLKQASYVDFGTKALAAAEAGAEYGLYQISLNANNATCVDTALPNPGAASFKSIGINSVVYNACTDQNPYLVKDVAQDDVLQANMKNPGASYTVLWQDGPTKAQAMEITILYSNYSIRRFAYNSQSASGAPWSTDNFAVATAPVSVANCPSAGFNNVSGALPGTYGAANDAIQVRAKPLGGPSTVQICGSSGLESQQYVVTSTATTKNNVTKKIQVTREINGTLPAVFDNVIFSGGNIDK